MNKAQDNITRNMPAIVLRIVSRLSKFVVVREIFAFQNFGLGCHHQYLWRYRRDPPAAEG